MTYSRNLVLFAVTLVATIAHDCPSILRQDHERPLQETIAAIRCAENWATNGH